MLIYNTTYQTSIDDARNFVIWLSESYIPEVEKTGILQIPVLRTSLVTKSRIQNVFIAMGGGRYSGLASLAYSARDASE